MRIVNASPDQRIWVPIDTTDTIYTNQLVKSAGDGVAPLGSATGVADTTNKGIPFGVAVGNDTHPAPVFDATFNSTSVTGVLTQAAQVAKDVEGVEGQWIKGDTQGFVLVDLIGPDSIIEAPLFNAAFGTAPSLLTVTTGSTTGLGFTSNACDFTPVADLCTTYCRSGANQGAMRISDDTSTTVTTNDRAFKYDIAIGDTFIRVPSRPIGLSYLQFDAESVYVNVAASPATNYYVVNVLWLDLRVAGEEKVYFKFTGDHFSLARA